MHYRTTEWLTTQDEGISEEDIVNTVTIPPSDDVVVESGTTTLADWVAAGAALVIGVALGMALRRAVRRVARKADTVTSTVQIVSQIIFGSVVTVSIYVALTILGINLAPLLAGAGLVSVVVGFALKDVAENYVSGILMGFNNPFSPGDQIVVDDGRLEGTVEELQLRYTRIRSSDGVRILMPNALLIKHPLENLTANGHRRSHFTIGVSFDTDFDEARRIAVETVKGVEGVLEDPEPEAFVEELAGSWATIRIRFWHGPRNHDRWQIRGRAITAVFKAIDGAGIDMPYRHRVVQIDGLGDAIAAFDSGGTTPANSSERPPDLR